MCERVCMYCESVYVHVHVCMRESARAYVCVHVCAHVCACMPLLCTHKYGGRGHPQVVFLRCYYCRMLFLGHSSCVCVCVSSSEQV